MGRVGVFHTLFPWCEDHLASVWVCFCGFRVHSPMQHGHALCCRASGTRSACFVERKAVLRLPAKFYVHVLPQFGSPSGHGAHPEREFCAPNVQAYAAGCGWVVRLASTHKYSLLRRTATETHHGTDPCSGTRTGGRGAPATYTRDGGATRPNLHATQTGPRRTCHASFKRWQCFQPSTRTLIRTGPHTGA